MILNTLEVIFSIIFHVLITQSAVINVKYVLFVVLQLLVLLTLGCCEIWVHHIPLLASKQDNLPIPVKYSKLALLYIWNVKEKNAWCGDFFVGVRPKWEVSRTILPIITMVNWQVIDHETNLFFFCCWIFVGQQQPGYGPPQQGYPPQGYGPPPQQGYGPPQQGWGPSPGQQQYPGGPPLTQGYPAPQQQGYGGQPLPQQGFAPPVGQQPGYGTVQQIDGMPAAKPGFGPPQGS